MLKRGCAQSRPPGFRWSKKAKITLETIRFWPNISISIFKFSPFLCTRGAWCRNPCNFSKFTNALIRKEKKRSYSSQWKFSVKIRCKNRGSPCHFLSSRGQKTKNITKIEHIRLFLFTLLVSFLMIIINIFVVDFN